MTVVIGKIVDVAFVPAFLLASAKLISLMVVNELMGFSYEMVFRTRLVPWQLYYESQDAAVFANSISSFVMYIIAFCGLTWIILRASIFHRYHVTPNISKKLANHHLLSLIYHEESFYLHGVIWSIYIWVITGVLLISIINGHVYEWVGMVALLLTIIGQVFLVERVEQDLLVRV